MRSGLALAVLAISACGRDAASIVDAASAPVAVAVAEDPGSRGLANPIAYIPPQCFTKTDGARPHNPCFVCHQRAQRPNYVDDEQLQLRWELPEAARENPWTNLFAPPVLRAERLPDDAILAYVRASNYFDADGSLALAERLRDVPAAWDLNHDGQWNGYVPDVWFRFDAQGFDHRSDGSLSGWRAFAYYPLPGAFFPANGSAGDVLIRLDPELQQDQNGQLDLRVYTINLAIVEALIRRADVRIEATDEVSHGVDLDLNGKLARATRVAFAVDRMRFVGRVRDDEERFPATPGLFPLRTEFFHSLRYLDLVGADAKVAMAPRMKEVRYAKKVHWASERELEGHAESEAIEQNDAVDGTLQIFSEFELGIANGQGWLYQGFIEDAGGELRPQTFEEQVYCVGCHGGIGATTDGTFAFRRKIVDAGWFHWSQRDLRGLPEPRRRDGSFEYTYYLLQNGAGDELRANEEILARFFDARGRLRPGPRARLHADIATLLMPSPGRALELDRAYKAIVDEQSFTRGREVVLAPASNVHRRPPIGAATSILRAAAP